MEIKTKTEILEYNLTYPAMNEYAKQTAVGFADWIFISGYTPIKDSDKWEDEDLPFTEYTTDQLYNIYLLTLTEK